MRNSIGLLFLFALCLAAQNPSSSGFVEATMQYVPNSATTVFNVTTQLGKLTLSNASASTVTCNLKDRSTNCNGAACQFWPDVSMTANSVYQTDFGGAKAVNGVQWSCSASNAVVGTLQGKQ